MNRKNILLAFAFILIQGVIATVQCQNARPATIIEALSIPDSTTNATVRIYQDKRIEQLVSQKKSSSTAKLTTSGFRVQVFSSNVQRTAKNDAFRVESMIREQFPDVGVYVNYVSPFWKVRVGDFKTQAQAQALRAQLISSFPQLRSEAYVVREQILVSPAK